MRSFSSTKAERYSAKKMVKPINFIFIPKKKAERVSVLGDFNNWSSNANPMIRQVDGAWKAEIPLHHGHHRYVFLVDGEITLDPKAQGVTRNERNERVSLISVS